MFLSLSPSKNLTSHEQVMDSLRDDGFNVVFNENLKNPVVAILESKGPLPDAKHFMGYDGVIDAQTPIHKFKLASKQFNPDPTVISLKGVTIGDSGFTVIAGPCAIENKTQVNAIAKIVSGKGAVILRGGAFKPRSSPYDFQGLGEEGLKLMRAAADDNGILCVSEVMSPEDLPLVAKYVDVLQIGSRNMHNSSLLKAVGELKTPVLLKRGLSASYMELLQAAEYIMAQGNLNVILCERGIRTFESYTRNTLDIAAVLALRDLTHLPVFVDPSHGTGHAHMVGPMAKAAKVVGADGIMIEVHNQPEIALCDGQQSLEPEQFSDLMVGLKAL